jgi:predicted type IV restriction endonuclease
VETVEPNEAAWEIKANQRIVDALPKIKRHAKILKANGANEATTRSVVSEMLSYALGYDSAADVDQESEIREGKADYGLRSKKNMIALVEVKRIGVPLHARHLNQLETYALHRGVRWAILTNGQFWQLYHIDGGNPTTTTLVTDIDLLDGSRVSTHTTSLLLMSKESLQRDRPIAKWREQQAKSIDTLRRVLVSDPVLRAIGAAIYRDVHYRLSPAELRRVLEEGLLKEIL